MDVMRIRVEAEVYPTESEEKVVRAIRNVFPGLELRVRRLDGSALVEGEGEGREVLENLKNMIRMRRIRAAARAVLKSSLQEGRLVFYLNKQAAYAGHVSFTEPVGESPLPPIRVEVEAEDLEELITWLTE